MSYQSTTIVGNLGRDPEMRYTPSGQPVCSFSVATNRTYSNANGEKEKEVTWFKVTAWGKLAETCTQYLHKGAKVLVEGRLQPDGSGGPRIWTKQDGTPTASFELTANTVRFLSERGEGDAQAAAASQTEDEIPF